MSDGYNRVQLLGNLGADPELRFTASGQGVLNIRLATTESYLDKDKIRRERTEWHAVTVWGPRAEALSKILAKGSRIFVEGSLRTSSYDGQDGSKRYKTEVNAINVIFSGDGGGRAAGAPEQPPQRGYGRGNGGGGGGKSKQQAAPKGRGATPPEDEDGGYLADD